MWAVHDGIALAAQMTRAFIAISTGWKEVDESHDKVKAALAADTQPPDAGTFKEK